MYCNCAFNFFKRYNWSRECFSYSAFQLKIEPFGFMSLDQYLEWYRLYKYRLYLKRLSNRKFSYDLKFYLGRLCFYRGHLFWKRKRILNKHALWHPKTKWSLRRIYYWSHEFLSHKLLYRTHEIDIEKKWKWIIVILFNE